MCKNSKKLMAIFFMHGLFLSISPAGAQEPKIEPIPLPKGTTAFIGKLNGLSKLDNEALARWMKDQGDSAPLLTTKNSEGREPGTRHLFYPDHAETIFSVAGDGAPELVVDTNSSKGIQPFLVPIKDKLLTPVSSNKCAACHTEDFTFIWDATFNERFEGNSLKKMNQFNQMLVKRAANSLFHKLESRRPKRFAKHLKLLMRLLVACEVKDQEWTDLIEEVKNAEPELVKKWQKVLAAENEKPLHPRSVRPLFLIDFLGVSPESIFNFRPMSGKKVFESVKSFTDSLGTVNKRFLKEERFGPLGAYGGYNDDLRGYLAVRLANKYWPKDIFSREKNTALLEMKPFGNEIDSSASFFLDSLYFSEYEYTFKEKTKQVELCKEFVDEPTFPKLGNLHMPETGSNHKR